MLKNTRLCALAIAAALSAGCGNDSDPTPPPIESKVYPFDTQVLGAWIAGQDGGDAYEFYPSTLDVPYTTDLKTGRVFNNGKLKSHFTWDIQTDGSIKLSNVDASCDERPFKLCKVVASATIVRAGASLEAARWTLAIDDNADGVIDRNVSDSYKRKELDLAALKQGEFFLQRGDVFDRAHVGKVEGSKISIRMPDQVTPVQVSADIVPGKHKSVTFTTGEATTVMTAASFTVKDVGTRRLPVKTWLSNFEVAAGVQGGFIVNFDLHSQIQIPAEIAREQVVIGDYEKVQKKTRSFGLIQDFVHGPTIVAGSKYSTYIHLDYNREWVTGAAGNEIEFTSATNGITRHIDPNNGKFNESRNFTWIQNADGSVKLTFGNGLSILMRFTKAVNGGHQVIFLTPHPVLGIEYWLHDFLPEVAPVMTEQNLPGSYTFNNNNGITRSNVTFNKDKTVTGVVNGFWFIDTNGVVVSWECTDLLGKTIASYAECLAKFNDRTQLSYSHIRRMRFMHKDGNDYQVKYDGAVWGGIFTPPEWEYYTISWTYRWVRVGN